MKSKEKFNRRREKEKGNILIISVMFIATAVVIFTFILAVFVSHINNILYNIKLDMYSMNRSAIVAVNKNTANIDYFSYDENSYKNEFIDLLKQNYSLDDELKNEEKLITSFEIKEYEIYEKKQKDEYTNEMCNDRIIHTVLSVKIKPIILREFLEDFFVFTIHEDVNLNMMIVGKNI